MLKFILGFLIGTITELTVLMIVAYKVEKQREKEILRGDNNAKDL